MGKSGRKEVVLATRRSALALAQTRMVAEAIARELGWSARVLPVESEGDKVVDRPLADIGGKEVFVKALQRAVAAGEADAAVHSLKDMAAAGDERFAIAAVLGGEDARDVVVVKPDSYGDYEAGATTLAADNPPYKGSAVKGQIRFGRVATGEIAVTLAHMNGVAAAADNPPYKGSAVKGQIRFGRAAAGLGRRVAVAVNPLDAAAARLAGQHAVDIRSEITAGMNQRYIVGTGAPRRRALMRRYYPYLAESTIGIRGNLQTRIDKLDVGGVDALVLAAAGVKRLGMWGWVSEVLPAEWWTPAAGQGLVAVECLADNRALAAALAAIERPAARARADGERAFAAALGGDCHTPMGAYATAAGGGDGGASQWQVRGFYVDSEDAYYEATATATTPAAAGAAAAQDILQQTNCLWA